MKLIDQKNFSGLFKGKKVSLYTLKNNTGMVVQLTNFGAKIVSVFAPDRQGKFIDVVEGYETLDEWLTGMPYFGALCGRYANRIARGKFSINGVEYQLPINNGPNSLHGGPEGFHNQVFDAGEIIQSPGRSSITFSYRSADGEEGYPGNLDFSVTYSLTDKNELILDYNATTDKPTHVNVCSHGFFNLAGCTGQDITGHELMINASRFTPVDENLIPTGELKSVEGSPMDFRKPHVIGERIDNDFDQLKYGAGYDHNWVLDKPNNELGLAAVYSEPKSGRVMEVFTTQPGVQFYSANWHDGSDIGKGGTAYTKRSAVCLEAQNYPDSPNKPGFPSTLLKPGETYKHSCIYKFSTK